MNYCNKPAIQDYVLRYSKLSPQEYLVHHGILGQKWGKKNGPPYPLNASDHSASEKKAGWRKSLDKGGKSADNRKRKKQREIRAPEKKGLTDKQKTALKVGAALAVTALAVYGGYKLKESGKLDELVEKGKNLTGDALGKIGDKPVSSFDPAPAQKVGSFPESAAKAAVNGFKALGHKETIHEAVTKVNPSGANTNCRACSIASVLRMLGMDVEALGSVQGGSLREAVEESFKGAKVAEIYSPSKERITNYILNRCGEGSSGVMSARYNTPTGKFEHAISWAVKDGVLSFFDGQKRLTDCSKYLDLLAPDGSAEIARLDNLELNLDGIKKYIK